MPEPDPLWAARELRIPQGKGPLTGAELLAHLEGAMGWRIEESETGLLDALRRASLEHVHRDAPATEGLVAGWLVEAGFMLDGEHPRFVLRRAIPPDDATSAR